MGNGEKACEMDKVGINGQMEVIMRELGTKTKQKEREN